MEMMQIAGGLQITGVVNNTHMIRKTTVKDIMKGYRLAKEVADHFGVPVRYSTCEEHLLAELYQQLESTPIESEVFPITLQMRDSYLDKEV